MPDVTSQPQERPLERARSAVLRYVPIAVWLPSYPRGWLRADLLGGLTSWGVMVPVALAYAGLAGVPPNVGLTTAFTALAAYAVFGTSRHLKVTTSSTMAIMSASVVGDLAAGDAADYLALTSALALIVGIILVGAGAARLGFISDFLTKSVVTGFIFGLAITIIVGQLPKLLGVPSGSGSVPAQVAQLATEIPDTNPYTLAVGLSSLALILGLRVVSKRIPGALIVLVLGIVAASAFDLAAHGVSLIGEVQTGVALPSLPRVPLTSLPYLAIGAAGIVFLAVGESVGAGRAFGARHGYEIDADQEMVALGAANLSSGLFGGFTVDGSLSQTATGETAGTKSQLSSLVTAALVLATAIFLAPLFENLPNAVLGAIVIAAVLGLMDVAEMRRYWAWRRTDFVIAMAALVGVVLTAVLTGLLVAVGLSLMFLLYRASRPHVAVLGLMRGHGATYGDLARHADAEPVEGLVIVRLDAPLYFFNANVAKSQILDLVAARRPEPRGVLLDMAATADLDVTTTDMLFELLGDLHGRSVQVLLAQVKGSVRDRMRRTGLIAVLGEDRIYRSLSSAVEDFQRWPPLDPGAPPGPGPQADEGPAAEVRPAPPDAASPDGPDRAGP